MLSGLFRELLGPGPADHGPPPVVDVWRMVLGAIVIACIILWVHLLPQPAHAEEAGFRAVVLVCPAGVAGPDCSRDNALDMAVQPVVLVTACAQVGAVLATHLSLAPGETHKIACERRKG
jgi:hypothetical protein